MEAEEILRFVNEDLFNSNTFLVKLGEASFLLVDPVYTNKSVSFKKKLEELGPDATFHIMITHEHVDHFYGLNELLPKINYILYQFPSLYECLVNAKKNLSFFFDIQYELQPAAFRELSFHDRECVLEELGVTVLRTPGHSENSTCILFDGFLFGGDTVIDPEMIVTKLPGGSRKAYADSVNFLKRKLLGTDIVVFPGHGRFFNLEKWFSDIEQ